MFPAYPRGVDHRHAPPASVLVALSALASLLVGPGCAASDLDDPCALASAEVLQVRLGENREQVLVLLDDNVEPTAEMGAQGGSHMLLGVHVGNPVLEDFGLDITTTAMTAPAPCDAPCTDFRVEGVRNVYVDDPALYTVADDGSMDILGVLVFIESWEPDRIRTITLEAVDQCGRTDTCELTW